MKTRTITAYKCKQCGHVMYPAHYRCICCNGREFEEIEPEGKARLLTYTIVNELPWGIDERGRVLGIVEFENGVRALGVVHGDGLRLGMKLQAGWGYVRTIAGKKVYGLVFES